LVVLKVSISRLPGSSIVVVVSNEIGALLCRTSQSAERRQEKEDYDVFCESHLI